MEQPKHRGEGAQQQRRHFPVQQRQKQVYIFVVNNLQVFLLGRPAIESLRLVSRVNTVADQKLLYMHTDLFQGLGKIPGKYHIQLKEIAQCSTCNSR